MFFFSFCSRHVLHVMFIMFSWAEWTQLACVFLPGRTSARFELIDHASNQVEASLHEQIFLIFFLFFSPTPPKSISENCHFEFLLHIYIIVIWCVCPSVPHLFVCKIRKLPSNSKNCKQTTKKPIGLRSKICVVLAKF